MKETLSYKLWNEEHKKMYREELMYSIGYNVSEEGFCIILANNDNSSAGRSKLHITFRR